MARSSRRKSKRVAPPQKQRAKAKQRHFFGHTHHGEVNKSFIIALIAVVLVIGLGALLFFLRPATTGKAIAHVDLLNVPADSAGFFLSDTTQEDGKSFKLQLGMVVDDTVNAVDFTFTLPSNLNCADLVFEQQPLTDSSFLAVNTFTCEEITKKVTYKQVSLHGKNLPSVRFYLGNLSFTRGLQAGTYKIPSFDVNFTRVSNNSVKTFKTKEVTLTITAPTVANQCTSNADCTNQGCVNGQCLNFCTDTDGDGYVSTGSDPTKPATCAVPANTLAGDCREGNANINPAATEMCNLADDDCDGQIDEGCTVCTSNAQCTAQGSTCILTSGSPGVCSGPASVTAAFPNFADVTVDLDEVLYLNYSMDPASEKLYDYETASFSLPSFVSTWGNKNQLRGYPEKAGAYDVTVVVKNKQTGKVEQKKVTVTVTANTRLSAPEFKDLTGKENDTFTLNWSFSVSGPNGANFAYSGLSGYGAIPKTNDQTDGAKRLTSFKATKAGKYPVVFEVANSQTKESLFKRALITVHPKLPPGNSGGANEQKIGSLMVLRELARTQDPSGRYIFKTEVEALKDVSAFDIIIQLLDPTNGAVQQRLLQTLPAMKANAKKEVWVFGDSVPVNKSVIVYNDSKAKDGIGQPKAFVVSIK